MSKPYFKAAADEYEKRLKAYCKLTTTELKERGEDERALRREEQDFLDALPKKAMTVALCVEGRAITSPELAGIISDAAMQGRELCFLIGSSQGMTEQLKNRCDKRISLSKLTLPHQMARVLLTEQIYRAFNILGGGKYHK